MKENEKINDNTMKPIKINIKEKQNKPQVPQSQNPEIYQAVLPKTANFME